MILFIIIFVSNVGMMWIMRLLLERMFLNNFEEVMFLICIIIV